MDETAISIFKRMTCTTAVDIARFPWKSIDMIQRIKLVIKFERFIVMSIPIVVQGILIVTICDDISVIIKGIIIYFFFGIEVFDVSLHGTSSIVRARCNNMSFFRSAFK